MNPSEEAFTHLEEALRGVGYTDTLLQRDYKYADYLSARYDLSVRHLPLAAFAEFPFDMRSACIGVDKASSRGVGHVVQTHAALGAPFFFEIGDEDFTCWEFETPDKCNLIGQDRHRNLVNFVDTHSGRWNPHEVLRSKSRVLPSRQNEPYQSELGFLQVLEHEAHKRLDRLLNNVLHDCLLADSTLRSEKGRRGLYGLVFRLMAAKVLEDRGHQDWQSTDDVETIIRNVESFYTGDRPTAIVQSKAVQEIAWRRIQQAFHFQNISVDTLAQIYENTLVSKGTREHLGTHGTPWYITDFVIHQLPIEDLPEEERYIFEPCSGYGAFLVAALRRLRKLLPPSISQQDKYTYLIKHLTGVEVDDFALEVSRLCLMLADYPNPHGWSLHKGDVFEGRSLEQYASRSRVVLCNPPFEDFSKSDRVKYNVTHIQKPAELLHKVMSADRLPSMMGIVLPRAVIDGRSYRSIRKKLVETYDHIEVVELPDNIFAKSDAETALLVAHGQSKTMWSNLHYDAVGTNERGAFQSGTRTPQWVTSQSNRSELPEPISFWQSRNGSLWEALTSHSKLGQAANIHRGIEFNKPLKARRDELISTEPKDGFTLGLENVPAHLGLLELRPPVYINTRPEDQKGKAYLLPWEEPKVFLNAAIARRGMWRTLAYPDRTGLCATQRFQCIWPRSEWRVETLAAILSGPIANLFLYERCGKRDITIQTLKKVPLPDHHLLDQDAIKLLVDDFRMARRDRRTVLLELDAHILEGYQLSKVEQHKLLSGFQGQDRPGAPWFTGYSLPPSLPPRGLVALIPEIIEKIDSDWEQKNNRRLELIDALIETPKLRANQKTELDSLQRYANAYVSSIHPITVYNSQS